MGVRHGDASRKSDGVVLGRARWLTRSPSPPALGAGRAARGGLARPEIRGGRRSRAAAPAGPPAAPRSARGGVAGRRGLPAPLRWRGVGVWAQRALARAVRPRGRTVDRTRGGRRGAGAGLGGRAPSGPTAPCLVRLRRNWPTAARPRSAGTDGGCARLGPVTGRAGASTGATTVGGIGPPVGAEPPLVGGRVSPRCVGRGATCACGAYCLPSPLAVVVASGAERRAAPSGRRPPGRLRRAGRSAYGRSVRPHGGVQLPWPPVASPGGWCGQPRRCSGGRPTRRRAPSHSRLCRGRASLSSPEEVHADTVSPQG